jgi:ankyrin repeat protein
MGKTALTGKQSDFLKIVVAAAGRGDLEAVQVFVDDDPRWVQTVGSHGRTMLWEASYRGKAAVAEFLLERGADVNASACHYSEHYVEISCYCVAKVKGRYALADHLLSQGATEDIFTSAYLGDTTAVAEYLDGNPTLLEQTKPQHDNMRTENSRLVFELEPNDWATPLVYAVSGGSTETVAMLLERGAEVRLHSDRLLGIAVGRARLDLVELLLEHGADAAKLPLADPTENRKLAELAIAHGYDINTGRPGWPPLIVASRGDKGEHPEKIQAFLELGADVNVRDYKGKTALHRAATAGFLASMDTLLAHGAIIDAADEKGETPLFDAVRAGRVEAVAMLLERGADPEAQNGKGESVVAVASRMRKEGAAEIVSLLARSAQSAK